MCLDVPWCALLHLVVPCCVALPSLPKVDVLFMDETFKLAPIGTCAPEDTQFLFVTATLPQVFLIHC